MKCVYYNLFSKKIIRTIFIFNPNEALHLFFFERLIGQFPWDEAWLNNRAAPCELRSALSSIVGSCL